MQDFPQLLQEVFGPMYGEPCWNVKRGFGSFLTLEFGDPHLRIQEPLEPNPSRSPAVQRLLSRRHVTVSGDWHLWIYCCNWRVYRQEELIGESSSRRRMDIAARELDGQALVNVERDPRRGRWYFDFDLGGRLETRPDRKPDNQDEQWYLYEPSGKVLTIRADGTYSRKPGDTPRAQELWLRMEAPIRG